MLQACLSVHTHTASMHYLSPTLFSCSSCNIIISFGLFFTPCIFNKAILTLLPVITYYSEYMLYSKPAVELILSYLLAQPVPLLLCFFCYHLHVESVLTVSIRIARKVIGFICLAVFQLEPVLQNVGFFLLFIFSSVFLVSVT